jgi:hypothetical protein
MTFVSHMLIIAFTLRRVILKDYMTTDVKALLVLFILVSGLAPFIVHGYQLWVWHLLSRTASCPHDNGNKNAQRAGCGMVLHVGCLPAVWAWQCWVDLQPKAEGAVARELGRPQMGVSSEVVTASVW